jgi:hypothetical protein
MLTLARAKPKNAPKPNVCKLMLDIAGQLYRITPLRTGDGPIRGFLFRREDTGTAYTVTGLGCSCPGSKYRKAGQEQCKHHRAAKACGLAL